MVESTQARLWLIATTVLAGILGGLAIFTFGYGEGVAYLQDDPAACANCHVMQPQYDSWINASHHAVASCNDCHLSHDPLGKWVTKADNGFFHSLAFTTGDFPDPIAIKPRNREVTQAACLYCHSDFVHTIGAGEGTDRGDSCMRCHLDVGHAQR